MNVLYVALDDPRLTNCGSCQRTHYLWEALKRLGTVYTVVGSGAAGEVPIDAGDNIHLVRYRPQSALTRFACRWFSRFTKYGSWPFRDAETFRRRIGWADVKFDAVVVRCIGPTAAATAWKIAPTFVDIDDMPLLAFRNFLVKTLPFGCRTFGHILMAWWQGYVLRKCTGVWVVKSEDEAYLPKGLPCAVLPNLARPAPASYRIGGRQERLLMSVGLMGYSPNYQGVDWFVENVWKKFQAKHPEWRYAIAGRGAPESFCQRWSSVPGVDVLGFVDDLDELYERATAVVAPIFSGAGTCIKIVESALHGRKTFVTPFAVRGIAADNLERLGFTPFDGYEDFEDVCGSWMRQPDDVRQACECTIQANAQEYNSFERFARIVRYCILQMEEKR